jgi:hypothetical protein
VFTGPLRIEEVGYENWEVLEPFRFESDTGLSVDVPAGFRCDLASIPKALRSLVSQLGYWTQPAVTHDLLYFNHRTGLDATITRGQADRIMLEGMELKYREYDVPLLDRRHDIIFATIQAGGLESWMTPEEKEEYAKDNELQEFHDQ